MQNLKQRISKFNADLKTLRVKIFYSKELKKENLEIAKSFFSVPMPEELSEFYKTFGEIELICSNNLNKYYFKTVKLNVLKYKIQDGLKNGLISFWHTIEILDSLEKNSNSNYKFSKIAQKVVSTIDANYQYIGYYTLDDAKNQIYFIYFDKNQKFGVLPFNQLDFQSLEANLNQMLTQSPAHQSLEELFIEIIDKLSKSIIGLDVQYCIKEEPNVKTEADKQIMDAVAKEIKNAEIMYAMSAVGKLKAVQNYKKCIEQLEAACQTDGYNYFFCINEIFKYYNDKKDEKSNKEALLYALKAKELLPKPKYLRSSIEDYYRKSDIFLQIAISNFALQDENSVDLEDALTLVSKAEFNLYEYNFLLFNNKLEILMRLNRKEEAYQDVVTAIDAVKKSDYYKGDFYINKIIKSDDFKKWHENYNKPIFEANKKFIEKADRIFANVQKHIAANNKREFVEQIPQIEIIDYSEAEQKYNIYNRFGVEDDDKKLIFLGDVYVKGDFDLDWFNTQLKGFDWEGDLYGAVITGNLYIDGDYIDGSSDDGIELKVMGNMECNWLFSEDGYISINGDLVAKYGISGDYNHGTLETFGKVTTPYILNSDHDMEARSETEFIYIDGGNQTFIDSLLIYKNGSEIENSEDFISINIINPKVWNKNDEFQLNVFIDMIKNGENPFVMQS